MTALATSAADTAWETGLFSSGAVTVDELVDEARATYERVSPRAAYQWVLHGRAVLVDIRPAAQRAAEGEVHPSLRPVVIERNVLEWRLDPRGVARLPWVDSATRVVVLCQEGYASSLAAATLGRLGLASVTDVVGGLRAWREAGLPVA